MLYSLGLRDGHHLVDLLAGRRLAADNLNYRIFLTFVSFVICLIVKSARREKAARFCS
jgi:hypothetical protein